MTTCVPLDTILVSLIVVLAYYLVPVMWHGKPRDRSLFTRITVQAVACITEVLIVAMIAHYYFK